MKSLSVKDKTAYFAKVRATNYVASLRLEGIAVPAAKSEKTASKASAVVAKGGKRHLAK
jgi:hypothetical protein